MVAYRKKLVYHHRKPKPELSTLRVILPQLWNNLERIVQTIHKSCPMFLVYSTSSLFGRFATCHGWKVSSITLVDHKLDRLLPWDCCLQHPLQQYIAATNAMKNSIIINTNSGANTPRPSSRSYLYPETYVVYQFSLDLYVVILEE